MDNNQNNEVRSLSIILKELSFKLLSFNQNNLFLKIFLVVNIFSTIILTLALLNSISLIFTKDYAAFSSMMNILKHIQNAKWLAWIGLIIVILHFINHHHGVNKLHIIISCLGNVGVITYVYFMDSTPMFTHIKPLAGTLKYMPLLLLFAYIFAIFTTYYKLFVSKQ